MVKISYTLLPLKYVHVEIRTNIKTNWEALNRYIDKNTPRNDSICSKEKVRDILYLCRLFIPSIFIIGTSVEEPVPLENQLDH